MCLRQSSVIRLWLGIIKGMLETVMRLWLRIIKGMLETVRCHMTVVGDNQGYA